MYGETIFLNQIQDMKLSKKKVLKDKAYETIGKWEDGAFSESTAKAMFEPHVLIDFHALLHLFSSEVLMSSQSCSGVCVAVNLRLSTYFIIIVI